MKHFVVFPAKPHGVSVAVKGPEEISHKMDMTIANWFLMSRDGIEFSITDPHTHPTVSVLKV